MTDEEKMKTIAAYTFTTFILFFIGALSAVIAGLCAFNAGSRMHNGSKDHTRVNTSPK